MNEQESCRELLYDALQDLVFETPIDKISVRNIVEAAGGQPFHLLQALLRQI